MHHLSTIKAGTIVIALFSINGINGWELIPSESGAGVS